jgi:alpha-1,2-mannosyltransferase
LRLAKRMPPHGSASALAVSHGGVPRVSTLSAGLVTLLIVHALGIPLILKTGFGTPRQDTIIGGFDEFIRRSQADDSWRPMNASRASAAAQPKGDLYEEIFFRRKIKFQYPPTSLLFIGRLSNARLNIISWWAVWITIALTVQLFRGGIQHAREPAIAPASRFDWVLACTAVVGLCLTFHPLIKGYTLGQIQVWVNAIFAAFVWAWYRGSKVGAGLCLGIACLIKPSLASLALWALVRREWGMLAGAAGAFGLGLAVSIGTYGLSSHLTYLRVLAFISQRGETYYPNQSFNGLLNRWLSNGDNLVFQDFEFSPPNSIVWAGTMFAATLLLLMALALPRIRRDADARFDLPVMALTATMVSPIAWEHHYGIVLPILGVVGPASLGAWPLGRWTAALLAGSFVLMGQYVQPAEGLADTVFNPLQSYTLFGGVLLLAISYAAMFRQTGMSVSARSPSTATLA